MSFSQQQTQIWSQDPRVGGIEKISLEHEVVEGPSDQHVTARRDALFTRYSDKKTRDFIYPVGTDQFNQVSTFTIISQARELLARSLGRLGKGYLSSEWAWGRGPLTYYVYAGNDANAYYSRDQRCLAFFYFYINRKPVFTCQSLDIVAHETGHAVLDALKPGFFDSWHPQTGALHEAFGDLTAIFLVLSLPTLRHKLLLDTRGQISQDSFLTRLAEQFGKAVLPSQEYLRSANNTLRLGDTSDEVHDLSQVLTGALYEILVKIVNYELDRNRGVQEPEVTLVLASQTVLDLFMRAILASPDENVIFADISSHMVSFCTRAHLEIIKTVFEQRRIPLLFTEEELDGASTLDISQMMSKKNVDERSCCGTLLQGAAQSMIRAAKAQKKLLLGERPTAVFSTASAPPRHASAGSVASSGRVPPVTSLYDDRRVSEPTERHVHFALPARERHKPLCGSAYT